jgi:adenine-specific DNA methylase
MKRAIEEGFPILEINRLSVPERNAFKPIHQMYKWFARRVAQLGKTFPRNER